MPRYRLTLEYDGTPFAGWQIQPHAHGPTVQGALTGAVRRFTGETVTIQGAGRTDAGVHALGQVAHLDLAKGWEPRRVRDALNFHLKPDPIAVLDCALTGPSFDARFSATARHYLFRILARRARPVIDRDRVWWVPGALDGDAMGGAARILTGRHDFTTFRAAACQAKNPVRTLDRLDVTRTGDEIRIAAIARSFLHRQVRSMVGSLKLVGEGKWTASDLAQALHACDRAACGPVAPAAGLYLEKVAYGAVTRPEANDVDETA